MSSSIGCLLAFLAIIFFYLIWPVMRVARFLFGNPWNMKFDKKKTTNDKSTSGRTASSTNSDGKIFRADEGEYVDFEEIKD